MSVWGKGILLGLTFAAVAAVAGLLYALPFKGSWRDLAQWVASFGCFGLLLGGVYAFDSTSDLKIKASPLARVLSGVVAALLLSLLWRWPAEGAVLSAVIGAVLGYFGMLWAKHVDF